MKLKLFLILCLFYFCGCFAQNICRFDSSRVRQVIFNTCIIKEPAVLKSTEIEKVAFLDIYSFRKIQLPLSYNGFNPPSFFKSNEYNLLSILAIGVSYCIYYSVNGKWISGRFDENTEYKYNLEYYEKLGSKIGD